MFSVLVNLSAYVLLLWMAVDDGGDQPKGLFPKIYRYHITIGHKGAPK